MATYKSYIEAKNTIKEFEEHKLKIKNERYIRKNVIRPFCIDKYIEQQKILLNTEMYGLRKFLLIEDDFNRRFCVDSTKEIIKELRVKLLDSRLSRHRKRNSL